MATFVVAHGAWLSGSAWRKVRPLLRAAGHEIFTPSYTGLGERAHLASPDVTLETHIQDIANVLFYEDLNDVILVGHSYGGMVATGVADRMSERIRKVIYLDAFVPKDGQSLRDLSPGPRVAQVAAETADNWLIAPSPPRGDIQPSDLAWVTPRLRPQPRKTFEQPIRLTGAIEQLPRAYIYCLKAGDLDVFGQFAARAKAEAGWQYEEIDSSHNPHVTAPESLAAILLRLAANE
jgi:pimeloyl-ACP methyl ester carboxylesterase